MELRWPIVTVLAVLIVTIGSCSANRAARLVEMSQTDTQTARVAICALGDVTETFCREVAQ